MGVCRFGPLQRQIPPRKYCDICEEFDLHETEDCPKQNTDLEAPNGRKEPGQGSNRPYCEICEGTVGPLEVFFNTKKVIFNFINFLLFV